MRFPEDKTTTAEIEALKTSGEKLCTWCNVAESLHSGPLFGHPFKTGKRGKGKARESVKLSREMKQDLKGGEEGLRRVSFSAELLFDLFRSGDHPPHAIFYSVQDGFPPDAELVNVQHSWPNGVELLIRSAEFEPVAAGEIIPHLTPFITRQNQSPQPHVASSEQTDLIAALREIRFLLPHTDEFNALELPAAVRKYINELGCRAGDPAAASAGYSITPAQF